VLIQTISNEKAGERDECISSTKSGTEPAIKAWRGIIILDGAKRLRITRYKHECEAIYYEGNLGAVA
jgi:hypothetical protein